MIYLASYQLRIGTTIESLAGTLSRIVKKAICHFTIEWRIKSEESICRKMEYYNFISIFRLRDVYGFRILVRSIKDAYRVKEKLLKHFQCREIKDFLKNPKPIPGYSGDGFRVLQLTFFYNYCYFEVQITLPHFHKLNESLHPLYQSFKYGL